LYDKIVVNDQEIGTFKGIPVLIRDSGPMDDRHKIVNKQVLIGDNILMDTSIASGRPGIFNYIEMGNIREVLSINGILVSYFDSKVEDVILGYFSGLLGRADIIHVPYYNDQETWHQLQSDTPPVLSRLGYKLFKLGFSWFKDFYIAEGWCEGPVKLTAEKPVDEEMVRRNLASIRKDVVRYLDSTQSSLIRDRGGGVLETIEKYSDQPLLLLTH